jgi:hypothetical protein
LAIGDLGTAVTTARKLGAVRPDIGGHGSICDAWLPAGEILARAGDLTTARRCFCHILRHRAGAWPHNRANGLDAVAATVALRNPDVSAQLASVANAIRARHGLVTPRWLTVASSQPERDLASSLTDDQAVSIALSHDIS